MKYTIYFWGLIFLLSCQPNRPGGERAKKFLQQYNQTYRGRIVEDFRTRYDMYSSDFLKTFAKEVDEAIALDSIDIIKFPPPKQLRLISLKNTISKKVLLSKDYYRILEGWDTRKRRNFPLPALLDRMYSPKKSLEDKAMKDGKTWYFVLMVEEDGFLKINPYNTEEFQMKRHKNILKKSKFEDLVRYVAFGNLTDRRKVNWNRVE